MIDDLVNGVDLIDALKDDLFRAYLYNWVDEIDEGVRHWGELGLAFTKALFDSGSRRELQQKVGAETGFPDSADPDTIRSRGRRRRGRARRADRRTGRPRRRRFDVRLVHQPALAADGSACRPSSACCAAACRRCSDVVGEITQPLDDFFNPITAAVDEVKDYVANFLKKQIEKRTGIGFEIFDLLKELGNKMDSRGHQDRSAEIPDLQAGRPREARRPLRPSRRTSSSGSRAGEQQRPGLSNSTTTPRSARRRRDDE